MFDLFIHSFIHSFIHIYIELSLCQSQARDTKLVLVPVSFRGAHSGRERKVCSVGGPASFCAPHCTEGPLPRLGPALREAIRLWSEHQAAALPFLLPAPVHPSVSPPVSHLQSLSESPASEVLESSLLVTRKEDPKSLPGAPSGSF